MAGDEAERAGPLLARRAPGVAPRAPGPTLRGAGLTLRGAGPAPHGAARAARAWASCFGYARGLNPRMSRRLRRSPRACDSSRGASPAANGPGVNGEVLRCWIRSFV